MLDTRHPMDSTTTRPGLAEGAGVSALSSHVHLWKPPRSTAAPTLLLLHGTGGDESDLFPLGEALLPDAALLSVRGNVLEHGAPRFFRRLREGVFDLADLAARTRDLADFIEVAAVEFGFSTDQLYAVGYSNGANIAASLLLTRPSLLAGAVLYRAMVPFEPIAPLQLHGRQVLVSAGRMDPLIPRQGTHRLATILGDAGAIVRLEWQQAAHGLVAEDVASGQTFLTEITQRPAS